MGASKGSGSGSKGVRTECAGWAWACGGPESSFRGWGCMGGRPRRFWGAVAVPSLHLGSKSGGAPRVGVSGSSARPSPTAPSSRPVAPPCPVFGRLASSAPPRAPPTTRPRPIPLPAPPRRSPIQMWVRGERAAPTSQASKMAPGGRL